MTRRLGLMLAWAVALCYPATAWAVPITGGLQVWLDSTDSSTLFQDSSGAGVTPAGLGDPVGVWRDKSGNGSNAVVAGNNPALRLNVVNNGGNGMRGLQINPSDSLVIPNVGAGSLNSAVPYTFFVVDQYTGGATGRTVESYSTNWLIGKWSNNNAFYNNSGFVSLAGAPGVNNPVIGTAIADGVANRAFYFTNGTNATAGAPVAGSNPSGIRIGAGEASDAQVSELIVYNRVLNAAERTIVENYLASKYGGTAGVVPLAGATDKYVGDTAANGQHDFEVAGVGRMDNSGVVSYSGGTVSTGAMSGGLRVAATGGLDDNEWLLAGHNGLSGLNVDGGSLRKFFLDVTDPDNDLAASLTFDLSDLGIAGNPNGYVLGYTSTVDGPMSMIAEGALFSGDQVTFNLSAALIADGQFALLTAPLAPEPGSIALFVAAIGALGGLHWRRRRK